MMTKDQQIMFFLGRLQGYIEQASHLSQRYRNGHEGIFELMADIEAYFHENIHKIFSENSASVEFVLPEGKKFIGSLEITQWT